MTTTRHPDKRYETYHKHKQCSVPNCALPATHEVYLYDLYDYKSAQPEEFFEQDYTCPFICTAHMEENERSANGRRVPRGFVTYPYTNRQFAQGYTIYQPIADVFSQIFGEDSLTIRPELIGIYQSVNDELISQIAKNSDLMYQVDPRRFEEIIGRIFESKGFEVLVTPKTRDGGRDIQAVRSNQFGASLYLIECKRYARTRRIGVEVVRGLYGVVQSERATKGLVVTTSTFSRDAIDFATPLTYSMSLHDYSVLQNWFSEFAQSKNMNK